MPTEKDGMLAGELYDPLDPGLVRARERARDLCQDVNATREPDQDARRRILAALFGRGGESVWMQPPFSCDYGSFEALYAGQTPWDIGRPQQAFLDMAGRIIGSVLDAGCGTGENALLFAQRGHKVTGIDFLEGPTRRPKRKAAERGLTATFLVVDALALKDLPEVFDSVIDSGLFHVFSDGDRQRYVEGLASVLRPGGRPFLLCVSDEEPGTQGPRRVMRNEGREVTQPGKASCLTGPGGEPFCYSDCYKTRLLQN